jgi:hypothetical protein
LNKVDRLGSTIGNAMLGAAINGKATLIKDVTSLAQSAA